MSEEIKNNAVENEEESMTIVLTDENGEDKEYAVLASFESEDGKNYVIYYDENDESEDMSVFAARVEVKDDVETLLPIETDEEWAMVDEVLAQFDEEEDEE